MKKLLTWLFLTISVTSYSQTSCACVYENSNGELECFSGNCGNGNLQNCISKTNYQWYQGNWSVPSGMTLCEYLIQQITLPVELISFEVISLPQGNLIIWKTYSEINSDYYLIEHSITGEFDENSVIGRVEAAGNSNEEFAYTFTDTTHPQTINYYRLIQVDINGDYKEYRPIAADNRKLLKVVYLTDMLGRRVHEDSKGMLFEIYEDGTSKIIFR